MKTVLLFHLFLIFIFSFFSLPQVNAQACFNPAVNYSDGSSPYFITTADFNNDGIKDLVIANTPGYVSVFLGNSNGTFGAAISLQVGGTSVTCADFDGDGKMDIAILNTQGLDIALGNGAGGFVVAGSGTSTSGATSVTSADFNGDGKIDLVYTTAGGNNNYILLNTTTLVGHPYFSSGTTFPQCGWSYSIITADFNGDGKADLATANFDSSSVSVYMGNGNGTFSALTNFKVGTPPVSSNGAVSVFSADVNGDSKLDLLVANGKTNTVSVLLGTGNGSFGTQSNYSTDWYPYSVTAADFNGDGKMDMATTNYSTNNTVSVLLGTGAGVFGTATSYTVGTEPRSIVSGDFNGDGKPDLATGNAASGNASVLINCSGAGVADFSIDQEIVTYPNPTSGKFNLIVNQSARPAGGFENVQMEVYNVMGEKIYQSINQQLNNSTIDISNQANGIYFLQLKTDEGIANKKIIIQK